MISKTIRIRDANNTQVVVPGTCGWQIQYIVPHSIEDYCVMHLRDPAGHTLDLNIRMEPFALWDTIVRQLGDVNNELD